MSLWLLVFAAVAMICAGCAPTPTYPTYRAQAPTPIPVPPPHEESTPHSVVRLVRVTPALAVPNTRITVVRRYTEKSELVVRSVITTRVATYVPKGDIVVLDRDVQFSFGFSPLALSATEVVSGQRVTTTPLGLSLLVRNGSSTGVTVDWNAVTLIDGQGRAYPVLHRGVKMADRSGVVAPSTIPPAAILEDFVYPKELVSFSSGRYAKWLGERFFERMQPGDKFSLYLPVKRGTETTEYQFSFEVLAPEAIQPVTGTR